MTSVNTKPCSVCCTVMLNRRPGYIFISGPAGGGFFDPCEACNRTGIEQEPSVRQGTHGVGSVAVSAGRPLLTPEQLADCVRFGPYADGSTKPNPDLMWEPGLPLADAAVVRDVYPNEATEDLLKYLAAGHVVGIGVSMHEPFADETPDDGFLTDENLQQCLGLGVDLENVPRLINEIFRLRRRVNNLDDVEPTVRALLDCTHPPERHVSLRDSGPKPEMTLTVCARCGCRTRAHDAKAWWVRPDIMSLSENDE